MCDDIGQGWPDLFARGPIFNRYIILRAATIFVLLVYLMLSPKYNARHLIGSRILKSAAYWKLLAQLYLNSTQNTSLNWIIRILLSLLCWPKMILLSGGHCTSIYSDFNSNFVHKICCTSLKFYYYRGRKNFLAGQSLATSDIDAQEIL